MRKLTTALVAAAAFAAFGFTAVAPPTELMTDEAGDGNAINGQGLDGLTGQNPTQNTAPVNATMDLVGLSAATVYDVDDSGEAPVHTTTGMQWRLATTDAPTESDIPTITRIITTIHGCTTWFQYYAGTNGQSVHDSVNVRILGGCGLPDTGGALGPSKTLPGTGITTSYDEETGETVFDIDFAEIADDLKPYLRDGAYIDPQYVEVRLNTGIITAPVIDRMNNTEWNDFTIGEDAPEASE